VKGSPTPIIIGNPHPLIVFCPDPVTVGTVWPEVGAGIRNPDISIPRIIDPLTIGTQVIIEGLVGYFTAAIIGIVAAIILGPGLVGQDTAPGKRYGEGRDFHDTFHLIRFSINRV
jgi:hypothetical protein